jgi:hypothetical protein
LRAKKKNPAGEQGFSIETTGEIGGIGGAAVTGLVAVVTGKVHQSL